MGPFNNHRLDNLESKIQIFTELPRNSSIRAIIFNRFIFKN